MSEEGEGEREWRAEAVQWLRMEEHIQSYKGYSLYLDPILVLLVADKALKHMEDVLLARQLLPPHCTQLLILPATLQIEQVVVLQLTKGRRRGIPPSPVREVIPFLCPVNVALRSHGPEYWPHIL